MPAKAVDKCAGLISHIPVDDVAKDAQDHAIVSLFTPQPWREHPCMHFMSGAVHRITPVQASQLIKVSLRKLTSYSLL
jgi:hypothetical protein